NDGAAAVLVAGERKAKELGVSPLIRIKGFGLAGADPTRTYKAVPVAVQRVLKKTNLTLTEIDLIEIQEAFAAQVLADLKEMGIGPHEYQKINVNGSGISLGHPIAATGTRVLVTLINEMKRRSTRYGLAAICGGGGLGMGVILELVEV
ncbi:MAG: acetyl-CoA C-acyltransferase, partial [Desulfatiglandales bacterium]